MASSKMILCKKHIFMWFAVKDQTQSQSLEVKIEFFESKLNSELLHPRCQTEKLLDKLTKTRFNRYLLPIVF